MITDKQYFMGRDILYKDALTPEIIQNVHILLPKVNALLADLGITDVQVSSGWRPPELNAVTPGASKKSLHMIGKAVDIYDPQHVLYDRIFADYNLLLDNGLWMEDKDSTPTWCHLDCGIRTARPVRIFKP